MYHFLLCLYHCCCYFFQFLAFTGISKFWLKLLCSTTINKQHQKNMVIINFTNKQRNSNNNNNNNMHHEISAFLQQQGILATSCRIQRLYFSKHDQVLRWAIFPSIQPFNQFEVTRQGSANLIRILLSYKKYKTIFIQTQPVLLVNFHFVVIFYMHRVLRSNQVAKR